MKTSALRFVLAFLFSSLFKSSFVFGQCPASPSVSISGNACLGSTLTASSSVPPYSIEWSLNGTAVSTQTANLQANATTIAGSSAGIGGSATNQLQNPDRIYVAPDGTMYIPDLSNNRILKWLPGASSGIVVAGGNGTGSAANQFNRPTSVFLDRQGNIYVTDQSNGRIQKWAPGATSGTTIAGGMFGYLSDPTDVFVDDQGTIYVSEQGSSVVKKWAAGSTIPIVVAGGNGYGSAANQLSTPTGIFVDAQGNIYICDTDNNRIQKWAPGATTGVTVAGGNGFGTAANQLGNPLEIYVDCTGTLYIGDFTNNRVQKWLQGVTSGVTIAGGNGRGTGANQLYGPAGVFMDASHTLYVADFYNHRIQKFISPISLTFTPQTAGSYTATIYYNGGNTVSNSITITQPKTFSVSITGGSPTICAGDAVQFTATTVNGGTLNNYQWKKNGVIAGANSNTYTDNNLKEGDVILCAVSTNAVCVSSTNATSNAVTIHVSNNPTVLLDHNNSLCQGGSRQLDAGNFSSYLWNDGSTTQTLMVNGAGTYYVTVKDNNGCKGSDTTKITSILPPPSGFLPTDSFVCTNLPLLLQPSYVFTSYLWSTGSTDSVVKITKPGIYSLEVTDNNNCKGRASITIASRECLFGFYIPTAFTPNNDGKNDTFKPLLNGRLKKFDFLIYDRWGQIVFHSRDVKKGWDGRLRGDIASTNTYVWICTYQLESQPIETKKGTVLLIK